MPKLVGCPLCSRDLYAPDSAVGATLKCTGCGAELEVGEEFALTVPVEVPEAVAAVVLPCKVCGAGVRGGDESCARCGAEVSDATRDALASAGAGAVRVDRVLDQAELQKHHHVGRARAGLIVIAALYFVFGSFAGWAALDAADDARRNLRGLAPTAVVEVRGRAGGGEPAASAFRTGGNDHLCPVLGV